MQSRSVFAMVVGLGFALAEPGQAQRAAIEFRGGANVPTFDITDAAKAGPSAGVGLSVKLADRWWLIGDADFGFHQGAKLTTGLAGPDVKVFHYLAKVGYAAYHSPSRKFSVILNAGAGAMSFDIDNASTFTYPAINVGAKLIFGLGGGASLVLSPQGDIAFSKKAELGTSSAWVWPFAAGLRFAW